MKSLYLSILLTLTACGPGLPGLQNGVNEPYEVESPLEVRTHPIALSSTYKCIKPMFNTENAYCLGTDELTGMNHAEWTMWYGPTNHMLFEQSIQCSHDAEYMYCGDDVIKKGD